MDCKEALLYSHVPVHELQASEEIFMDIYMCCFIATLGAVGNFLLHASMEQIAFLSRNPLYREYALFWSSLDSDLTQTNEILLRFYSDI